MEFENLEIVCNASELSEEEYALIRKDSLGASDSSIICGVNLYKKLEQLIVEKNSKFITPEEKEIGKKPAVRMGRDLEPLVLQRFAEKHNVEVVKPVYMYRIKEFPYLTVNFDGVIPNTDDDAKVPVEAKCVTRFGAKYYNKLANHREIREMEIIRRGNIQEHIKYYASKCGIPAYYYTQVQQQLLASGARYGYLSALFIESWEFVDFLVPRDEITITHIISAGAKADEKITKRQAS